VAITDSILQAAGQQPVANTQVNPNQNSWVSDLLSRHFQPDQARIKRNPVGFQFQRDPFDPSSYYKTEGMYREISKAATAVTQQEAANRQATLYSQQQAASQAASGAAVGGVAANFVYGNSRKYHLSHVSANTAKAADYFGSKYGIKSVGGYRSQGSVPGSDHPKGRATDFMINNIKNGHAIGTSLANDAVKNYKAWNIKYVIWNRYIWTPSRGWHKYSGPSPHTDHVHVSYNK
jgi:hypothetical protein